MRRISILIFLIGVIVWGGSNDDLLKEGIALREAGNLDQAILKFQEILLSKAKHAPANYELGKTYLEKGDCENAIVYLKNAFNHSYDKFQSYLALGQAYEACGNSVEAAYEYGEAVRLKPGDPECICCQARVSQQFSMAESLYLTALKIDQNYVPAMVGLAGLYANNKQNEKALSYYQKAKTVKPNYAPTYYSLGNYYLQQKMYAKSVDEMTKYIQLEPRKPRGYMVRADAYSKLKNDSAAVKDIYQAISLGDATLGTYKFLGFLLNRMKRTKEYREVLKQIVVKEPYDVQSWLELAKITPKVDTAKTGWAEAAFAYNKVISIDTLYIREVAPDLAMSYYSLAKYDSAAYWFKKRIQYDTLAVAPYVNLALCYIQLKDYKKAIENLQKALRLNPKYVRGHLWLAQLYEFLNMKKEAMIEYNTVLKLDPKNKEAREGIARLKRPPTTKQPSTQDYWDKYWDDLYKPK